MTMFAYPDAYAAFDLETTGLSPRQDRVIEIGLAIVRPGEPVKTDSVLIRLDSGFLRPIITEITGITYKDLMREGISIKQALVWLTRETQGLPLVGHNVLAFDMPFIVGEVSRIGGSLGIGEVYDTMGLFAAHRLGVLPREGEPHAMFVQRILARRNRPQSFSLAAACEAMEIPLDDLKAHRAAGDALAAHRLFEALRVVGAGVGIAQQEIVRF